MVLRVVFEAPAPSGATVRVKSKRSPVVSEASLERENEMMTPFYTLKPFRQGSVRPVTDHRMRGTGRQIWKREFSSP